MTHVHRGVTAGRQRSDSGACHRVVRQHRRVRGKGLCGRVGRTCQRSRPLAGRSDGVPEPQARGATANGTAVPDLPAERRCCRETSVAVPCGVPAVHIRPPRRPACALDAGRDRPHRPAPAVRSRQPRRGGRWTAHRCVMARMGAGPLASWLAVRRRTATILDVRRMHRGVAFAEAGTCGTIIGNPWWVKGVPLEGAVNART